MEFLVTAERLISEASKTDVFRIEHVVSKLGPYRAGYEAGEEFAKKFKLSAKYNPDPIRDNSLKDAANKTSKDISWYIRNGIFAFGSIQDMKRWFTSKGIQFLLDTGEFHIVKKSVPSEKVICGEFQCVVDKKAWDSASAKVVKF